MKLYATVASERASKGQGGNKYINFNISIGTGKKNSRVLASGTLKRIEGGEENGFKLYFSTVTGIEDQCIDYFISDEEVKAEQ